MERQYYVHDGNEQKGPFTYNQLESFKEEGLMVWHEDLEKWQLMNTVMTHKQRVSPTQKTSFFTHLTIAIAIIALSHFLGFFCARSRSEFWEMLGLTIGEGLLVVNIFGLIGYGYLFFSITKIEEKKLKVLMIASCVLIILVKINALYEVIIRNTLAY